MHEAARRALPERETMQVGRRFAAFEEAIAGRLGTEIDECADRAVATYASLVGMFFRLFCHGIRA